MDQSLLDLLPQIHALFSDPLRVVMMEYRPFALKFSPRLSRRVSELLRRFIPTIGVRCLSVLLLILVWLGRGQTF
jgi:DNA polymerase delta subunit 3